MYKHLKLFPFASPKFWQFFSKQLDYSGNTPIRNALMAVWGNYCKSVVVEPKYVDKDYLDEFSAYYSKTFKVYPHRCLRLHFFLDCVETEGPRRVFPTKRRFLLGLYHYSSY